MSVCRPRRKNARLLRRPRGQRLRLGRQRGGRLPWDPLRAKARQRSRSWVTLVEVLEIVSSCWCSDISMSVIYLILHLVLFSAIRHDTAHINIYLLPICPASGLCLIDCVFCIVIAGKAHSAEVYAGKKNIPHPDLHLGNPRLPLATTEGITGGGNKREGNNRLGSKNKIDMHS